MDARNMFHTKTTYRIIRGEHLLVLVVTGALMLWNYDTVNWWRAFIAFWVIDIVGYLPGAMAYRKSKDGRVHHWFHHAYNIAHTYLVCGAGVAVWAYVLGGLEWAMLAVPFHLSVDRGVFGNILKPVELSFEPSDHTNEQVFKALGRISSGTRITTDVDEIISTDALSGILEHPSGYLALSDRNHKFAVDGIDGFIAYRQQGKHLWMFGGVHVADADAGELLDRFMDYARAMDKRVAAVQVRANQAELFAKRGFSVNQMGSTYAVSLDGYSFAGGKKMRLRNKIKKARKQGLRVVELGKDVPATPQWFAQLDKISESWLAEKGKQELDFMIGELGDGSDEGRRIFLVVDSQDQPVAFISYVPVLGQTRPGYLHDLTRKIANAPTGAMELCNAAAIERFQEEGIGYLHFGFTPFIIDPEPESFASRLLHRAINLLRKYGAKLYPADSQLAYKSKWGTDVVEREYLAVRPISLRAAMDLMRLTKTI